MTHDPTTGMPPMIGRCLSIPQWLDYVARYDFGTISPSRVVLHHTAIPTIPQWRGITSMRGMQAFYAGKGWTAAPHLYVAPDGIWLFTPMKDVGIHAGTGNSGKTNGKWWYSIGVEMVGYYDKERPSGAVWDGTKAVLGGLSRRLGIAPDQLISFHRDYTDQKSCPGWAVQKPWVFDEVNAWLNHHSDVTPTAPQVAPRTGIVMSVAVVRTAPSIAPQTIVRKLQKGTPVVIIGTVDGDQAAGTRKWYKTADGNYIHSGAIRLES